MNYQSYWFRTSVGLIFSVGIFANPSVNIVNATSSLSLPTGLRSPLWPAPRQDSTPDDPQTSKIESIRDFYAIMKSEGPAVAQSKLKDLLLQDRSDLAFLAASALATRHIKRIKDNKAAVEVYKLVFDHYHDLIAVSEVPDPQHVENLYRSASSISSFSQSSSELSADGCKQVLAAIHLLMPLQQNLKKPDHTSQALLRLFRNASALIPKQVTEEIPKFVALTEAWFQTNPDDVEVCLVYLKTKVLVDPQNDAVLELHANMLKKFPVNYKIFEQYRSAVIRRADLMANEDPKAALALLEALTEQIDQSIDFPDFARESSMRITQQAIQRVQPALKRLELIGQQAPIFEDAHWVQGEPINLHKLRGKVILLDFWAVWSQPCIETIPLLRKWNADYAQQGLEIIGVTQKFNYSWNDEQKLPVFSGKQDRAAEAEMLGKFLQHHQVEHRIMLIPDNSEMPMQYSVTEVPQAVLIDKRGTIRMVRVGNQQAGFKALEKMVQQLITED